LESSFILSTGWNLARNLCGKEGGAVGKNVQEGGGSNTSAQITPQALVLERRKKLVKLKLHHTRIRILFNLFLVVRLLPQFLLKIV